MKKKYIHAVIGLLTIGGGFTAANLTQRSINKIADGGTCWNIFASSSKANEQIKLEKSLINEEQIKKINQQLEKNLELSEYELMYYDNFLRSCQSAIKKESKVVFTKHSLCIWLLV